MNRREKSKKPKKGMIWSDRYKMWVDPDRRSPRRRAKDEAIAQSIEKDQKRIQGILRAAQLAQERQAAAVEGIAERLALDLLRGIIEARKKAELTQAEVARRMDLPQSAVVRLEAGTHSPTLSTLSRYAAAIGVKLEVRRIA